MNHENEGEGLGFLRYCLWDEGQRDIKCYGVIWGRCLGF